MFRDVKLIYGFDEAFECAFCEEWCEVDRQAEARQTF